MDSSPYDLEFPRIPSVPNSAKIYALLCLVLLLGGCSAQPEEPAVLRLATTTSTRDSGLLDELLPVFEAVEKCRVDVIAVGTGAALELGKAGDADVLIVHARQAEEAFMEAGHGTRHEEFMFNHFAIVGPVDDPAKIEGLDASAALQQIAAGEHRFVSRGDDSGTHKRELQLWAKGRPHWKEYLEIGQGMGPTLFMADELRGYTLTDIGTYLKLKAKLDKNLDLVPLVTEGKELHNPYAVIVVHAEKNRNTWLAVAMADFLIAPEAQRLIGDYRVAGEALFVPTRSCE